MKRAALQQYTKQKILYQKNDQQILDKFIAYIQQCADPINVFKYMEQKSICIYLANYWIYKAQIFANMGDFNNACICLKQAESRNQIINQDDVHMEDHINSIYKKIVDCMRRKPPKGKRSAFQYEVIQEKPDRISFELLEKMADIFQKQYEQGKKQAQKTFNNKVKLLQKSWLAPIQERKSQKLEEKIKSLGNLDQFHSMRTPISKKDPMKLTKTMDSIQMLKKKKSTKNKRRQTEDDDSNSIMFQTTPVSTNLTLKRRVTFLSEGLKIQKIRSQLSQEKINSNSHKKIQNGSNITKRSSILKNKGLDAFSMDQQQN